MTVIASRDTLGLWYVQNARSTHRNGDKNTTRVVLNHHGFWECYAHGVGICWHVERVQRLASVARCACGEIACTWGGTAGARVPVCPVCYREEVARL